MKNHYWILAIFLIGCIACQNTSTTALKPLDLLQYGIPITILAPDSAKVVAGTLSFTQDVTVKSAADNFDLQIFSYDATTTDLSAVKASHLAEVKSNAYFSEIIQEEDAGFIYSTVFDSTSTNYGFKYLKIQGDKEYIFQTGLVGNFALDDVKMMYKAVKNEAK
ncbi:MAG: hypothetical protein AAGJ18_09855 [Bacteroidota bacterium]